MNNEHESMMVCLTFSKSIRIYYIIIILGDRLWSHRNFRQGGSGRGNREMSGTENHEIISPYYYYILYFLGRRQVESSPGL